MLNTIVEEYTLPFEGDSKDMKKVNELLDTLKKPLKCERLPKILLEQQKLHHHYPLLDPSFLSKNNLVNSKENGEILLPAFAFYPFHGKNTFSIGFEEVNTSDLYGDSSVLISPKPPKIFVEPLLRSLGLGDFLHELKEYDIDSSIGKGKIYNSFNLPRKLRKKIRKLKGLKFTSTFNAIIPENTKEKISEAEKYFTKEKSKDPFPIYIIAEVKPEEWNESLFVLDPLVVGVKHNKCCLIDHFDTTRLEDYVRWGLMTNNPSN